MNRLFAKGGLQYLLKRVFFCCVFLPHVIRIRDYLLSAQNETVARN
jgi:hypothetical protein